MINISLCEHSKSLIYFEGHEYRCNTFFSGHKAYLVKDLPTLTFAHLSYALSRAKLPAWDLDDVKGNHIAVNLAFSLYLLLARPSDPICPVKLHCLQFAPFCGPNPTLISSTSTSSRTTVHSLGFTNPFCYRCTTAVTLLLEQRSGSVQVCHHSPYSLLLCNGAQRELK